MTDSNRRPLGQAEANAAAERLHREAIIFDMVAPLFESPFPRGIEDYIAGGVTAVGASKSGPGLAWFTAIGQLRAMAQLYQLVRENADRLMIIDKVDDFARAKESGRLGVVIYYQSCSPFEDELGFVELFYRLGLRAALLTYNTRNLIADGCTERTNAGLSKYGVEVIKEMNRVGMVVDCSHVGERSSLDAIEVSQAPVIFSHSGCKALHDHPRNITDEQIRASAASGGVVGVFALPFFLAGNKPAAIDDLVRHIAHIADLVGVEHAGIGMDYFEGLVDYRAGNPEEFSAEERAEYLKLWNPGEIPAKPPRCAPGIETPAGMRNLTAALFRHGFTENEVRQIMGENFLRVFRAVWK